MRFFFFNVWPMFYCRLKMDLMVSVFPSARTGRRVSKGLLRSQATCKNRLSCTEARSHTAQPRVKRKAKKTPLQNTVVYATRPCEVFSHANKGGVTAETSGWPLWQGGGGSSRLVGWLVACVPEQWRSACEESSAKKTPQQMAARPGDMSHQARRAN